MTTGPYWVEVGPTGDMAKVYHGKRLIDFYYPHEARDICYELNTAFRLGREFERRKAEAQREEKEN